MPNVFKYLLNVKMVNFEFSYNLVAIKHYTKVYRTQFESLKWSQVGRLLCLGPSGIYREAVGSIREQEPGNETTVKRMIGRLPSSYLCEQNLHTL